MATLFVRHRVGDFIAWKRVYDEFDAQRRSMGVTSQGVYQAEGDPTDVTVYHEFSTASEAKAFTESPELRDAMQRAGVQGTPDVWVTNRV